MAELLGTSRRILPTALVVGAGALLALTGQWRTLWPAFGASNQLVAALALLVVGCWLVQKGRRSAPVLVPALLMLVTTLAALAWQIRGTLTRDGGPNWFLAGVNLVLVALALLVGLEAWGVVRGTRKRTPATQK